MRADGWRIKFLSTTHLLYEFDKEFHSDSLKSYATFSVGVGEGETCACRDGRIGLDQKLFARTFFSSYTQTAISSPEAKNSAGKQTNRCVKAEQAPPKLTRSLTALPQPISRKPGRRGEHRGAIFGAGREFRRKRRGGIVRVQLRGVRVGHRGVCATARGVLRRGRAEADVRPDSASWAHRVREFTGTH